MLACRAVHGSLPAFVKNGAADAGPPGASAPLEAVLLIALTFILADSSVTADRLRLGAEPARRLGLMANLRTPDISGLSRVSSASRFPCGALTSNAGTPVTAAIRA